MSRRNAVPEESGFALILALLALLLLTFLGVTLTTTTSTELQIATNFRWGQQALYNAEAGLEVARAVLGQVGDGQLVLPPARALAWTPPTSPELGPPDGPYTGPWMFNHARNGENGFCDYWGDGMGFGQILADPNNPTLPLADVNDVSTILGGPSLRLSGTFTVWVRRELVVSGAGLSDNPSGESIVVTSEGTAPFGLAGAFQQRNRAVRRLESAVTVREGCRPANAQTSQTGFSDCELL